jgi:hypothetical protein
MKKAGTNKLNIVRPTLSFDGIQIKSEECFHLFADAVDTIEHRCGIHSTRITLSNVFFCPDINKANCRANATEVLLIDLIEQIT